MDVTAASLTDVGRTRTNNEDALLADADLGLYVVCDGMGGHNAGEVASQAACEVIAREITAASRLRERFLATSSFEDQDALRLMVERAVASAGREIFKRASRHPELTGMGTTCTLVLIGGHHKAVLAHVGDSRLYVYRGGRIHQLSEDHTYVNELVRRGSISRDQARSHPQGNVLSRALGVQPMIQVDTMVFDVDPGDTYLLCTDGLHNYFPNPKELFAGLSVPDLRSGLAELARTALDRGGHDNVTAIAFRVPGQLDAREAVVAAERRITVLKRLPLFSSLTYTQLVRVVGITQLAQAAPGQIIAREGDAGSELFVILAGEVDLEQAGKNKGGLSAGGYFGELAMLDSVPRPSTVRARTGVTLLVMRRAELLALLRSEPVVASKLLWSLSQAVATRRDAADTRAPAEDAGQGIDVPFDDVHDG